MKEKITYIPIEEAQKQLDISVQDLEFQIKRSIDSLPRYIKAILKGAKSNQFASAIQNTEALIYQNRQADPRNGIAKTAGAYFANENVIAGSMTSQGVALANMYGSEAIPDWEDRSYKIKLGPGITFLQPASLYSQLQKEGASNPELAVNYTAPFGTNKTRQGLADIINARLVQEGTFSDQEVIQTSGCTEALELGLEAICQLFPGSEVLSLGFSYYTVPFTADQKKIAFRRVMPEDSNDSDPTFFQPQQADIRRALNPETKTLLLTVPNNPTGESYNSTQLREIMLLAKEKNLLILFDAIFEEMYFDQDNQFSSVLNVAQEIGVLDQIIIVDSLSKRRGYAGARFGWLATKNQKVLSTLENSILARRCNPPLIYESIAQFEGLASQFSKQLKMSDLNSSQQQKLARQVLKKSGAPWLVSNFLSMYQQWDGWRITSQEYYRQNLEIMRFTLDGFAQNSSFTQASFNAFVKLGENINSTDFMAKLMLLMGTYTQVGPCFGISEKIWKDQLGLWARVSFATERTDLIEGLTRLIALSLAYQNFQLGDESLYPALNVSYDQQV